MANLDLSDVIRDPLFTSEITVQSMGQSWDAMGNPIYAVSDEMILQAVVTGDSKPIERLPDGHRRAGGITVRFCLADVPPDFSGKSYDRVIWRGSFFVVQQVRDCSQFGRGFMTLVCAPEEPGDGSSGPGF